MEVTVAGWRDSWQEAGLTMVPVSEIAPHPANFRTTLTDLEELAESIATQGLTSPLEVMPADRVAKAWPQHAEALAGYAYVLLSGHRRLAAAQQVFADSPEQTVPVLVRWDGICQSPVQQLDAIATEDSAHRAFNPIEQARAFQASAGAGRSQRQIAQRYGCAQGHVSRRISLLRLPEEIQQAVETGHLGVHDALKLAKLDDQESMRAAWGLYLNRREDAWITSVEKAITVHANRTAYQARREAALAQAATEGLRVVEPMEEFRREVAAHQLTDPEQVAAARSAGTLVAAISGFGELEYYTTEPSPTRPAGPDADQRRAAAAARERAGRLLAAQPPAGVPETAGPVIDALLRGAPDGWRPIARRWLRWLQVGPDAGLDPAGWWERVYVADWQTRVWAAHCLALAACEHRARTRPEWDQADEAWLWRLVTEAEYLLRPWERQRLAKTDDDGPIRETTAGHPGHPGHPG